MPDRAIPPDLTWAEFPPHITWDDLADLRAGRVTWNELANSDTDDEGA